MSVFEFKVIFLDENDRKIDDDVIIVSMVDTDDPEDDRDQAYIIANEKAEEALDEWGAWSSEISLADVY